MSLPRQIYATPQRPISEAQRRVLLALCDLCPVLGQETGASAVAASVGMQPSATALALGGLQRRKLVEGHGPRPQGWTPTFAGRELVRRLPRDEVLGGEPRA